MAQISNELKAQLKSMPNRKVELIVKTHGDATPHLQWLASEGIEVSQQFRLSPGVAVSCTGAEALKLLDQGWVKSVELDAPVQAM